MIERIITAGSGGQGIMLLGKVLASAGMRQGKFVTWLPAYGPEVRGGTSHCSIIFSDQEIGSPCIDKADTMIIMNNPSLDRFKPRLENNGLLILNSSLAACRACGKLKVLSFPFTDIAIKLGNIKVANMVALGCYVAYKKLLTEEEIIEVFRFMAKSANNDLVAINQKALKEGIRLGNG